MNRCFKMKSESSRSLTRDYIPNTLNSNQSQKFRGNWRPWKFHGLLAPAECFIQLHTIKTIRAQVFTAQCFKLHWTPCESHDWHWAHAKNRGVCMWLKLHKNITYSLMQQIPALLQAAKWFPEGRRFWSGVRENRTDLPSTAAKGRKHLDLLLEKYIKRLKLKNIYKIGIDVK